MDNYRERLIDDGYQQIEEFKGMSAGTKVYHSGHQWPGAMDGTAVIEGVFQKPLSSWQQSYGRPDIEILVKEDRDGSIHQWADYHTHVASTLFAEVKQ